MWSAAALILLLLFTAGGSYLWFRAQVASANRRVTDEVRQVLQEKPSTTLTTAPPAATAAIAATAQGPTTSTSVKEPSPSAMNILVIGSDRRTNGASIGGRSDTLMIVHVDPEKSYLSVLSLPRDLRVDIPGHGKGKLNTAYAFGGPALAIKTIEQTTGVDINHYMEVGFGAFTDIVDSLGGVYLDVDRRYYNPDYYYEPIDLYPGYQLVKGADALDFVRFRHDRNMDFGRMERQQQFMTAMREQAMGWDLPFKLPGVISALFSNTATDLDANEFLRLAKWGIGLSGDGIRGITLKGSTPTINGASYVVATEDQLAHAVDQLLHVSASVDTVDTTPSTEVAGTDGENGSPGTALGAYSGYASSTTTSTNGVDVRGITVDVTGVGGRPGEAAAATKWLSSLGATVGANTESAATPVARSTVQYPAGMLEPAKRIAAAIGVSRTAKANVSNITLLVGSDFVFPAAFALPPTADTVPDADVWKQWAPQTSFAVRAPFYLPDGYEFDRREPNNRPTYDITVGGGTKPALRMMYTSASNSDQVLGITETTWLDAPAASKGLEVTHDGVVFTVVRNDTKVERVWWKADGVLYFVSNTLSHWLDQEEMLKVAESIIVIPAQ